MPLERGQKDRAFSLQQTAVLWHLLEHPNTHGYLISKATRVKSGTLYPMLERFESDKRVLLKAAWLMPGGAGASGATKPKKVYFIPEKKRESLRKRLKNRLVDFVSEGQDGVLDATLIEARLIMLERHYGIDWDGYGL